MPLDLTNLGEVALWRDGGDFFVPDDGVPLPPAFDDYRALPAATFTALVAEVEAARKAAPREATPVARDDKPILFSHEKYDGLHQTIVRQFVNCYAGFDPAIGNMTQRASWAVRPIMDAAVAMANDAVHRDRGAS